MKNISSSQISLIAGSVMIIALIGHFFLMFLAAGQDDTFIMLWAGQTLGHGPWFVNYNYDTQEIASSIIGALIAALTKGMPVEQALLVVKMAGLLSACATLYLIWRMRRDIFGDARNADWLAWAALTATAASPVFMYWALGGLETPHHALLMLAYALVLFRSVTSVREVGMVDWWLFGVGVLLVLVRTEAFWPVFFAASWLALFSRGGSVRVSTVRALALTMGVFAFLLLLRYLFTGAIWPNPVYAKIGNFDTAVPQGVKYVRKYFLTSPWAWVQGAAVLYATFRLLTFLLRSVRRQITSPLLLLESVLAGLVLSHLGFVILAGGNWMVYFRFISAVVPLMNILVLLMAAHFANRIFTGGLHLVVVSVLLSALSLIQIEWAGNYPPWSCSKPITMSAANLDLGSLGNEVLKNNCEISRDINAVQPFLDFKLAELLRQNDGHLTVASYQGGYFPYHLRKRYGPNEVLYIDSMGLTERQVAILPATRSAYGVHIGRRIDLILLGKAGPLSDYLNSRPVNLVYLFGATPEERYNYEELGFETVWDVAGAVVFYRPTTPKKVARSPGMRPYVKNVTLGDQFGALSWQGRAILFIHPGASTPTSFDFAADRYLRDTGNQGVVIEARIAPNIPEEAVRRGAGDVRVRVVQDRRLLIEEVVRVGQSLRRSLRNLGSEPLRIMVENNGSPDTDWLLLSVH